MKRLLPVLLVCCLAACSSFPFAPTPTVTATITSSPTQTPTPTASPTLTPTLTFTPTPAAPAELPADYGAELSANHFPFKYENNQLWVDWQDGQGLRPAGTYDAASQTWDWGYFQYGGPALSEAELTALAAKDELCSFMIIPTLFADQCIFHIPAEVDAPSHRQSAYQEKVMATGRTAYGDYRNSFGNTGKQFLAEVMGYDPNGRPFTHWVRASLVLDSQPGTDVIGYFYDGFAKRPARNVDELKAIWQKGKIMRLCHVLDPKEAATNVAGWKQDAAYFSLLASFINAGGYDLGNEVLQPTGIIWKG